MEHFLQIKILHGVATVLLFGGLLGLAFYAWRSWRTGDAARVARGFKRVRLIGWPLGQSWLLFGACLYLLGCIFWLVLAGRLARVQHQAGAAETAGAALGEQTLREIKVGLVMALLGAASFIAVAVLMVSKPL